MNNYVWKVGIQFQFTTKMFDVVWDESSANSQISIFQYFEDFDLDVGHLDDQFWVVVQMAIPDKKQMTD